MPEVEDIMAKLHNLIHQVAALNALLGKLLTRIDLKNRKRAAKKKLTESELNFDGRLCLKIFEQSIAARSAGNAAWFIPVLERIGMRNKFDTYHSILEQLQTVSLFDSRQLINYHKSFQKLMFDLHCIKTQIDVVFVKQQPVSMKKSSSKGEAQMKLIAALLLHHGYSDGHCKNSEPIGSNALCRDAKVSPGNGTAFFKAHFGGIKKYQTLCFNNTASLVHKLKVMEGGYQPEGFRQLPKVNDDVETKGGIRKQTRNY